MLKRAGQILFLIAVAGASYFFFILPGQVDGDINKVAPHEAYPMSETAKALKSDMRLADLHADTLLWSRDLLKRCRRGHVDLPRLEEGGYRLQVFSAVTKTPKKLNYDLNTGDTDNITLLAIAERWPPKAWTSLFERALYIARKLDAAAARSDGRLAVVHGRQELDAALGAGAIAGILATEGAHPLEGKIENVDRLYAAGYRVMGLQHFFDNELGGSLHGVSKSGLTEFGQAAVARAEELGMIIDVAHSSEAVVRDVLEIAKGPIIVSHAGLKGECDSARNLPDELMLQIAARGGLVGVGFWDGAVCATSLEAVADAIAYAVKLLGPDHVALGSDFDGATTTPFDAAQTPALIDALLARGVEAETIALVLGENEIAFFQAHLPE